MFAYYKHIGSYFNTSREKIIFHAKKISSIFKDEYMERRKTESRSQIRLSLGIGPISFDRMLAEIGVNLAEDKAIRINRKVANG